MAQDKSPVRWFHQPSPSDRCLLSVAPSRCALGAGLESTDRRQPQPLTAPRGHSHTLGARSMGHRPGHSQAGGMCDQTKHGGPEEQGVAST